MNPLGDFIKKKLIEQKISERKFAQKCGLSHSYINQIIKGINPRTQKSIIPSIPSLNKIAEALNADYDLLQKILLKEDNHILIKLQSTEDLKIQSLKTLLNLLNFNHKGLNTQELQRLMEDIELVIKLNFEKKNIR